MRTINKLYTVSATGMGFNSGLSANQWRVPTPTVSLGLITIDNPLNSGVVVRIYRVRWANLATVAAVIGFFSFLEMWRVGPTTDGIPLPIIPWVWDGDNVVQNISVKTNATGTHLEMFRRAMVSLDELTFGGSEIEGVHSIPYVNYIWDTNTENSNIDPIVIRPGSGFEVCHSIDGSINPAYFASGTLSLWVDFTVGVN